MNRIPDFLEPLDWALIDINGMDTELEMRKDSDSDDFEIVEDSNQFVGITKHTDQEIVFHTDYLDGGALASTLKCEGDSEKDIAKFIPRLVPLQRALSESSLMRTASSIAESDGSLVGPGFLSKKRAWSAPSLKELGEIPRTNDKSDSDQYDLDKDAFTCLFEKYCSFSECSSSIDSQPDYSDQFPKEIFDIFGRVSFSQIPFCGLSEKNIADIQEEDLTAPFMLFCHSKEGFSGMVTKGYENGKLIIDVYFGDKNTVKNWVHLKFSPKKVRKNKAHLKNLEQRISMARRGDKRNTLNLLKIVHSEHLAAQLTPAPIDLPSTIQKIQSLLKKLE